MRYNVAYHSIKGKTKENNEDNILLGNGLYILADGATYSKSPEFVSFVIAVYSKVLQDRANKGLRLEEIMKKTNGVLQVVGNNYPPLDKVSSTLDILHINEQKNKAYYAHTGNGRIYTLDLNNKFENRYSDKKVDRSYIGSDENFLKLEIGEFRLDSIKYIAMVSDGVTSCTAEEELKQAMLKATKPIEAVKNILNFVRKPKKKAETYAQNNKIPLKQAVENLSMQDDATAIIILRGELK